jgi:hypothetical protein
VFLFLFGGTLAKIGIACASRSRAEDESLSAGEILERLARTYANCETYQDGGCVTTLFINANGKRLDKKPFSTAFIRPDKFRFEFKSSFNGQDWHRYMVWADGDDVRSWWHLQPEAKQPPSLDLALAAATGVSGSSAHTIPALLMSGSIGGRRLTDLTELERLTDSRLNGVDCFRIQGRFVVNAEPEEVERRRRVVSQVTGREPEASTSGPRTLWIDKSRLLLLQMEEQTQFDSFRTESTTTYEPQIDMPVSHDQLQFDPPGN